MGYSNWGVLRVKELYGNFEGLKDDVLSLIAGERVPVNTDSFTNDMTTFQTEENVKPEEKINTI